MRVSRKLPPAILQMLPRLRNARYAVRSRATDRYNCVAFAAGDTKRWWWPDQEGDYHWPKRAPREESVQAFARALATRGYKPCRSADLEPGFEKVAVFVYTRTTLVTTMGAPSHLARQRSDGMWVSKLGEEEDIEHASLDAVAGDYYGRVEMILRRPRRKRG